MKLFSEYVDTHRMKAAEDRLAQRAWMKDFEAEVKTLEQKLGEKWAGIFKPVIRVFTVVPLNWQDSALA